MEGTTVKIIIKAPNQQIKDQIVKCDIGWSVAQLKEHLSDVYPSKPVSFDALIEKINQRLIYSGQLLIDSTCLKDVLRQYDGQEDQAYTVHLVCASQKIHENKMGTEQALGNINSASTSRDIIHRMRLNNSNNVQSQNQNNSFTIQHNSSQLYSTQQYFDPRNSQQLAWMQQAYTHYFTQYMQLMAAQGIQLQTSIPYIQQLNGNANEIAQNPYMNSINNNNNNNNTNNNNNNNHVGDEPQQPVIQEVDAGNNGAGDDGAFNRDALDVLYILSKAFALFIIVYFYSSPLRFFIVTFIAFTIYLYQGGFFRVQPLLLPENNNGRGDQANNNNQMLHNEGVAPQPVAQQQNGQIPTVQAEARTNANEGNEERPGALAISWTLFWTFFASLIPDQPNVI